MRILNGITLEMNQPYTTLVEIEFLVHIIE